MQLFPSSEQLSIFSERRCIQMPGCFCHRFPHSTKLRFHTHFWTTILLHQMRFWNQGIVPCQWYPFVLWSTLRSPHANWTLLGYSIAAERYWNQSASAMFQNLARWHGTDHQQWWHTARLLPDPIARTWFSIDLHARADRCKGRAPVGW